MSPPPQPTAPSYSDYPVMPPPGAPGYAAPSQYQGPQPAASIMSQFSGNAATSIIVGLIAVGIPIVTGMLSSNGSYTFLVILPIFGIYRGIVAITRGQVIGGIVGLVLNLIGGGISVISLLSR